MNKYKLSKDAFSRKYDKTKSKEEVKDKLVGKKRKNKSNNDMKCKRYIKE